ncbi:MAG: AbgT family transporter [Phycisphaerales bacterium]
MTNTEPPSPVAPVPGDVPSKPPARRGILDWIEFVGNKLPEPALLFAMLAGVLILLSGLGSALGWKVQPTQLRVQMVEQTDAAGAAVRDAGGKPVMVPAHRPDGRPLTRLEPVGEPIVPRSLMTGEGVYWMLSSMIRNFTTLPALGLIFVAILGIGLAEKFGFFSALMRQLAIATPRKFLTPMVVLLGSNSSVASDAGYIILPPLAAALYVAVGRHPLAGLAAAFSGVAGGFGSGFFPTGGDGVLAGFAQDAARIVDPSYNVGMLHNIYFKAGSALVVMLAGWFVTDRIVEPRLRRSADATLDSTDTSAIGSMALSARDKRALVWALVAMGAVLALFAALIFVPGAPLHGEAQPRLADGRVLVQHAVEVLPAQAATTAPSHDVLVRAPLTVVETVARARLVEGPGERWSHVIVPIIFFAFLTPGVVYGILTGTLRTQKDFIEGVSNGVRSIVPVLVIAFFMGQFVNYFAYSRLDRMLAYAGGSLLVQADVPIPVLIVLFVLLVIVGDFAISGMLSKFGVLAPIFIPMFMMVGKSPELTTAAYRIGDSVVNVITPMNSYLLIILMVLQKYKKNAGLGSLISLMLPYSVVFGIAWTGFLLAWYYAGLPLGPNSPLHVSPP